MDNRSSKANWMAALAVASVWFGTHVGGGFATGNQTVQYFVRFGWTAVFMPFCIIVLLGWCYYNATVMAKNHKAFRYNELASHLYAPFSTAGKLFFDAAYIILVVVGAGIAIAGAGSLFKELWGLNYYIGIVIAGSIFFILTIFGAGLVRKASSAITIAILVCLIMLLIPGLKSGAANISKIVGSRELNGTFGQAVWMALLYAGFQSLVAASIISTSQKLDTRKRCAYFGISGTILNGVMTALCAIMILGHMPQAGETTLPIFSIASSLNQPILLNAYSTILFLAFVSTGVGVVFGLVARFENLAFKNISISKRRILISFLSIVVATSLSVAGLTKLVAIGYGWLGRISVFLLVIPLAVIAPIKNSRFKKNNPTIE